MGEALRLAPALAAGFVLGAMFFLGLLWTVEKGISSQRPALWFLGSRLLRTGLLLAGFYLVARGHWERFPACLLGFLIARSAVLRLAPRPRRFPSKEAAYASYPG